MPGLGHDKTRLWIIHVTRARIYANNMQTCPVLYGPGWTAQITASALVGTYFTRLLPLSVLATDWLWYPV
jgi:hypothetical protein